VIWRKGEGRIVVPMRVQHRARRAVDLGITEWVDDTARQIPPLFSQARSSRGDGSRAAMFESISAAEVLLATLVEYQRRHHP
jgi:hypothetical protein